jgi:hypothetical protein
MPAAMLAPRKGAVAELALVRRQHVHGGDRHFFWGGRGVGSGLDACPLSSPLRSFRTIVEIVWRERGRRV